MLGEPSHPTQGEVTETQQEGVPGRRKVKDDTSREFPPKRSPTGGREVTTGAGIKARNHGMIGYEGTEMGHIC